MGDISKLTKDEMINYLYVRDIIKSENITNTGINYTNIMLYLLPFILILILILLIYLVYKQYYKDDKMIKNKKPY
jgi:hypothetical protein